MLRRLILATLLAVGACASAVAGASVASAKPAACRAKGAVTVRPGADVRRIVARTAPGRTICFAKGRYRLSAPLRPQSGQTLIGVGATLDGGRVLRGFRPVKHGWRVTGQHQQGQRVGYCASSSTTCRYPDDVLRDGRPLRRVLSRTALTKGTYFFDYPHDAIIVHDRPTGHTVEALVAPTAIAARTGRAGAGVTVRGFTIEHFATLAQHGAIEVTADGWSVIANTVRDNHGAGITSNGHVRIIDNVVARNGQLGIGGSGPDTTVSGNTISYNNPAGAYDRAWEAGGAKWAVADRLVVTGNRVIGNKGPGLWTDIDASHTTFASNVVRDNADAGIFVETSNTTTVRNNVVTGNGHGFDAWLWGAGIQIAASHHVTVSGNRLSGNRAGISLIQQDRGVSIVDKTPHTLHDITISDNDVTMSGGQSGGVTDDNYEAMFTDPSITWTDNTWRGARGDIFAWNDEDLTAAQWRDLGHDRDGRFL